ncbi:uncharacterized protein BDV14DRAFT_198373 [Aspergillus stella-maris]|uniref:uncharacterized protein n=1 Tax=Aspergillus stella-maris TaxID=1810926 RepID=UPI003CCCB6BC
MFGDSEGVVWMTKESVGAWYRDPKVSPNVPREKMKKEQEETFYSGMYIDLALNAPVKKRPNEKHPHTSFAVGGAKDSFEKISIMYGKDPGEISSTYTLHQDKGLFNRDLQAFLIRAPMPEPDNWFVGIDLTYGIPGVYFPLCFDMPWPYDGLVQLVRLDFKHRYIRLPFARAYDPGLYSQPERDLLKGQVEKAGLEIVPERSVINGKLHPVLQNTTRFTKKILGEKVEVDQDDLIQEAPSFFKEQLLQWIKDFSKTLKEVPTGAEVEQRYANFGSAPAFKGITIKSLASQSEANRNRFLDTLVKEFEMKQAVYFPKSQEAANWGRGPAVEYQKKKYREWLAPDWKAATHTNDEYMAIPTLSHGGQPDCLLGGQIDFSPSPQVGLGLEHPGLTLRIDVRELICYLTLPSHMVTRTGAKEVGYQNVSGGDGSRTGFPIDFYARNMVVAFPCRDIKVTKNTVSGYKVNGETTPKIAAAGIDYPQLVKSEFGFVMTYMPPPTDLEKQIISFMIQILPIAADMIPVIGAVVGFAIYVGGNTILDSAWISQFEHSTPPVCALLYSQKGNVSKYIGPNGKKIKLKLK